MMPVPTMSLPPEGRGTRTLTTEALVLATASVTGLRRGNGLLFSVPAPALTKTSPASVARAQDGSKRMMLFLSAAWRSLRSVGETHSFPPPPRDGFSFIEETDWRRRRASPTALLGVELPSL